MAGPRKYSDQLRERAVHFYFESNRRIAHVAQDLGNPQGSVAAVIAPGRGGSRRPPRSAERRPFRDAHTSGLDAVEISAPAGGERIAVSS
jgi:transposase-like protein